MKKLKTYLQFFEDGTATVNASTTGGMGPVVSAPVGQFAGVPDGSGSGDTSNFLGVATKQPVGGPSKVSNAQLLKKEKTNKVKDIKKEEEEE